MCRNGFDETVAAMCRANSVPSGDEQTACHLLLARAAVRSAVNRHVGSLKSVVTPNGEVVIQRGKDLTQVRWLVGAGGPVAFSSDPIRVLEGRCFEPDLPTVLKPKAPEMLLDAHYILFALGLLAQTEPAKALSPDAKICAPPSCSTASDAGAPETLARRGQGESMPGCDDSRSYSVSSPAYEVVPAIEVAGRIPAMTLMSNNIIPGADHYVEAGWILGMPDPNPHIFEHTHDYDEIVMHIGSDPNDQEDLGGEIEFILDGQRSDHQQAPLRCSCPKG